MSQPYVGECRLVGFSFQVNGWNFCNGAILAIAENSVLFQLIGTTYGGDGQQTFALPDLQGRVPIHQGPGYVIGQRAGVETVTLTSNQMPIHNHVLVASSINANSTFPENNVLAAASSASSYVTTGPPSPTKPMNAASLTQMGGNQPHENMQPFLVMNWIISLFGVFPSQN